jgi:hypothetical protein
MIAAGIVLAFVGILVANLLGEPSPRRYNSWDYAAGVATLLGAASLVSGLTVFAWRYLP